MNDKFKFSKRKPTDKIMWADNTDAVGEWIFTFDGKKTYNMFQDYPWALTKEEKETFDQENPNWARFFRDRG